MPAPDAPQTLPLLGESDIVRVRQVVREQAVKLGLSLVDQTKFVTATSELARNTMTHGGGGRMELLVVADGRRRGLRLVFIDEGPGIPDIELAMRDGYTTRGGMGLGLSGAKRLSDAFVIESEPGRGTRVTITKWAR